MRSYHQLPSRTRWDQFPLHVLEDLYSHCVKKTTGPQDEWDILSLQIAPALARAKSKAERVAR